MIYTDTLPKESNGTWIKFHLYPQDANAFKVLLLGESLKHSNAEKFIWIDTDIEVKCDPSSKLDKYIKSSSFFISREWQYPRYRNRGRGSLRKQTYWSLSEGEIYGLLKTYKRPPKDWWGTNSGLFSCQRSLVGHFLSTYENIKKRLLEMYPGKSALHGKVDYLEEPLLSLVGCILGNQTPVAEDCLDFIINEPTSGGGRVNGVKYLVKNPCFIHRVGNVAKRRLYRGHEKYWEIKDE